MKKYFFCLLSAVLISSPSYAQSPFDGFNAGIITGAINGKFTISTYTPYLSTKYSEADETYFDNQTNANNVSESGSGKFSTTRVPAGLFFGYNKDFGAWGLAGIRADLSSTGLKESKTNSTTYYPDIGLTPQTTIYLRADNLATLRAKYGFTVDPTSWVYLTGGIAFADIESKTTFTDEAVTESNNQSEHKTGWIAGIGVEKMIDKFWSINVEYHYTAFGNITGISRNMADSNHTFSNQPFTTTTKLNMNAFEIGISRHF
jgi:opacity protein-like surface antigen